MPRSVLFYKPDMAWPRRSGHDVHTFHMMRAMAACGAHVALATDAPCHRDALEGAGLRSHIVLRDCVHPDEHAAQISLRGLEERYRSFWGVPRERIARFAAHASEFDAVVVSGLGVLPMLGGLRPQVRIWYAADEWIWHHLSQLRVRDSFFSENLRDAVVKGLYERAYRGRLDRAWVVSAADARAMRWLAGVRHVDIIPNGVDTGHFAPREAGQQPDTAVFWGNFDFNPNVQALQWFCREVWPSIIAGRPTARFTILGFHPRQAVDELARGQGIEVVPDLPDIREEVARRAVVVLPFVSGGGIKNKLLEAAAMGKAIVASGRAMQGLRGSPPVRVVKAPRAWVETLYALWDDEAARNALGGDARAWVVREHTWEAAARSALASIDASLGERA